MMDGTAAGRQVGGGGGCAAIQILGAALPCSRGTRSSTLIRSDSSQRKRGKRRRDGGAAFVGWTGVRKSGCSSARRKGEEGRVVVCVRVCCPTMTQESPGRLGSRKSGRVLSGHLGT